MKKAAAKVFIGIDEVGRGPLAGPVAVGAAMATPATIRKFRAIKESKQLTRSQREEWYAKIREEGSGIRFAVSFVAASMIDKKGIVPAIKSALAVSLTKLHADPSSVRVLLDGGLYAPPEYRDQQTIIRGDASETIIAIASIVAKVERDRMMKKFAVKYPRYGWERNVGYGTKSHCAAILTYGLTPLHRRTFCTRFV